MSGHPLEDALSLSALESFFWADTIASAALASSWKHAAICSRPTAPLCMSPRLRDIIRRKKGAGETHKVNSAKHDDPLQRSSSWPPPMNGTARSNGHARSPSSELKQRRKPSSLNGSAVNGQAVGLPKDFWTRWEVPRKVLHSSIGSLYA